MKAISEKMDRNECTAADIFTMVRLRIRNLQAFKELQSYNDTGTFRYQHPLVEGKSERAELIKLLQQDPQEFLKNTVIALILSDATSLIFAILNARIEKKKTGNCCKNTCCATRCLKK